MSVTISFLGAAQTVTGSRYLVESSRARILVDCGMFQGFKRLRARNWDPPRFKPSTLSAVVLTHAHIDHSGYLPRIARAGFRGPVHCTRGTADLLQILLPDSGHLHEEDARRANRYGYSKHHPALPLYTEQDARDSLQLLRPHAFGQPSEIAPGVTVSFSRAGHIVGSACVRLVVDGVAVTLTGDIGRPVDPIMKPPPPLADTDVLMTESTYGDRRHPETSIAQDLADVVNETVERGGALIVPAFAVGRSQHLLHLFAQLRARGEVPDSPVFLDSPMAINATRLFCNHTEDHRLSEAECMAMCNVAEYATTPEQSKEIDRRSGPMLVVSASGMATGGRVLHHLRRFLPSENNTILFVGYQAGGTRGRRLLDGAEEIKIHGQFVPVRARIAQVQALSAHADHEEIVAWLGDAKMKPRQVFVTHGEPSAAAAMRERLSRELGWNAVVPEDGSRYTL